MKTVIDKNGTIEREYDALNRVTKYTDTFGRSICYEYDSVGNLTKLIYPDNTAVNYTYDSNNNLETVTDWANRVTRYSYDQNNKIIGITKPDGSTTSNTYDTKQRILTSITKSKTGDTISGYEYVYDVLDRIIREINLENNSILCYNYDKLNRVVKQTTCDCCGNILGEKVYTYDAAGNISTDAEDCSQYCYETNNLLASFNGNYVTYDSDGNMTSCSLNCFDRTWFTYDSANRLIQADEYFYTYNAENSRIKCNYGDVKITYTHDVNNRLSRLLYVDNNGSIIKYVYGNGLIGEESNNEFKTYHFDYRGSTIAITNDSGNIIDTFAYDTYGGLVSHTGSSDVIFLYNGRDGVITDKNGLYYMRARYYSPKIRRFINADILHGEIADSTSLNRYAYVNGNPVSFVDPFGLAAERGNYGPSALEAAYMADHIYSTYYNDERELIGKWNFLYLIEGGDNMVMGVYTKMNEDGIVEYTLVNRGTVNWDPAYSDLSNNLLQPVGLSNDMKASIQSAKDFVEANKNAHITFVGHSKGGAEALANAKATNKNAIVFNPAIPNYEFYGLGDTIYTAKATSYVVIGEVLSSAYIAAEGIALSPFTPMTPGVLDNVISLVSRPVFYSKPFWETEWVPNAAWSPVDDHGFADIYSYLQAHPEK